MRSIDSRRATESPRDARGGRVEASLTVELEMQVVRPKNSRERAEMVDLRMRDGVQERVSSCLGSKDMTGI